VAINKIECILNLHPNTHKWQRVLFWSISTSFTSQRTLSSSFD